MRELPKVGDTFYLININAGIVTKSNPKVVKDRYLFALCSYEFTDGDNRFDVNDLYPCDYISGGPGNSPIGMGSYAFIYALEKDVDEATKFLREKYAQACVVASLEAKKISEDFLSYAVKSKGE